MHERVADRLTIERLTPVLDIGCGEGELARHLPAGAWVGADSSLAMLARAPSPTVAADATELPFEDASFHSVALLYRLTFDAEVAPELLGQFFADIEIERWDAPLLALPTQDAVCDYLVGKGVKPPRPLAAAADMQTPLIVTKRGVLAFARRPRALESAGP